MTEIEKITSIIDADLINLYNEINDLRNRVLQLEGKEIPPTKIKIINNQPVIACNTRGITL